MFCFIALSFRTAKPPRRNASSSFCNYRALFPSRKPSLFLRSPQWTFRVCLFELGRARKGCVVFSVCLNFFPITPQAVVFGVDGLLDEGVTLCFFFSILCPANYFSFHKFYEYYSVLFLIDTSIICVQSHPFAKRRRSQSELCQSPDLSSTLICNIKSEKSGPSRSSWPDLGSVSVQRDYHHRTWVANYGEREDCFSTRTLSVFFRNTLPGRGWTGLVKSIIRKPGGSSAASLWRFGQG